TPCGRDHEGHTGDDSYIPACKIRHQTAFDGPISNVNARDIPRPYRYIISLYMASLTTANQIVRVMRKVGIHLINIIISPAKSPFKSCDICGPKAQFSRPFDEV